MPSVLSERISRLQSSPVREILRAAGGGDLLSLAGGLPAEETFPDFPGLPDGWTQYGTTEGELPLREEISVLLSGRGLECPPERILVLNGSQQGLDLAAKLFVDRGTSVLCESPTYLAALQVFRLFGAELHGVPIGPDGPDPDAIAIAVRNSSPRLAYLVPTYQNPTGAVWSEAAREAMARCADDKGVAVLEDDPYAEIGFGPTPPPPICSRIRRSSWMYLGSFSKSFVPGLRLGFLAASPDLVPHLERLKQAADLHSNRLSQALVLRDLRDPARPTRMGGLRSEYRSRRDAFDASLRRHFPSSTWRRPDGGLFFWARLSRHLDLRDVFRPALDAGVAFLPGEHCHPGEAEPGWARLNFSHCSAEKADKALEILAGVVGRAESQP
ncbi:MAG TPA: PLP-dependent aminotransferase family protein [Fibrobacteria bacterium]|nr:PLP-dependent aminotransferase family protein [Fibrobacteria bacterium]